MSWICRECWGLSGHCEYNGQDAPRTSVGRSLCPRGGAAAWVERAVQSADVRPDTAQQLKAEIAALADKWCPNCTLCPLGEKLRQLSAV